MYLNLIKQIFDSISVLMTFVKQFNSLTDILMEKLRTKADGKTVVSLLNEMNRATLDAIASVNRETIYRTRRYFILI